jgi:DNA transformation protein and related proteins
MAVSETFRALVLDQLARVAPAVAGKRMFGGLGIYSQRSFFALADNDRLYLKADEQTRDQFEAQGWEPFRPHGDDGVTIAYYEVPLEVIENVERLQPWVELALGAAERARKNKRKTTRRTKPTVSRSKKRRGSGNPAAGKNRNRGLRVRRG